MNDSIKYIIDYSEGKLSKRGVRKFEKELLKNDQLFRGNIAFNQFNKYMQARFDLEDVKKDPALHLINPYVEDILSGYDPDQEKYINRRQFIMNSLEGEPLSELDLVEEIQGIKQEIDNSEIDPISKKWVKEWNEKAPEEGIPDEKAAGKRLYITSSLEPYTDYPESATEYRRISNRKVSGLARISILAAAALIALFFGFRVLMPSYNPDKIYKKYYRPMEVFSPVSRNVNVVLQAKYTEAVEMYRQGNYQTAASVFADLMRQDSSMTGLRFYAGITQMGIGNYSMANTLLFDVANNHGDYRKDAEWYFGLSCLMTGDLSNGMFCFEDLAGSDGYYRNRAKNILRRLK
jgi:hypothetical protein